MRRCARERSSSRIGEIIRHGPHQPAQKSTITGTDAVVSSVNDASSAWTIHGNAVLHFAQRGVPDGIAPTRFRAPQFVHVMIDISLSVLRPVTTSAGVADRVRPAGSPERSNRRCLRPQLVVRGRRHKDVR